MLKNILRVAAGAALSIACTLSNASEPMMLDDAQLDSVSAGSGLQVPDINQFSSTGALAWATSTALDVQGKRIIISVNAGARVGLYNNGVSFTYSIQRW